MTRPKTITTLLDPSRVPVEVGDKVEMKDGAILEVSRVFSGSIFFYASKHTRQLGGGRTESYTVTTNWDRLQDVVKIYRRVSIDSIRDSAGMLKREIIGLIGDTEENEDAEDQV